MSRTAMTKAKRGSQKDTAPEAMLKPCLEAVAAQSGIDKKLVEDICIGSVLQPGAGNINGRMAGFLAGYPETTSFSSCNRLCSSGLQAVMNIANSIKSGQIDIGIGGGVDSMTMYPMDAGVNVEAISPLSFDHPEAQKCLMGMGQTSENVAEKYGLNRKTLDQFAVNSHMKAAKAMKEGWLQGEITPYETIIKDKDDNETTIRVDKDEGVRP